MFGFKKKDKIEDQPKKGLFGSLKDKLSKTRSQFSSGLSSVFSNRNLDEDSIEELEDILLTSDVGIDATTKITQRLSQSKLEKDQTAEQLFKQTLADILEPCVAPLSIPKQDQPFVILMIGINGAGKTTTIGKLAQKFQSQGLSVMLAAGDTFRAAAVEQLQTWGERLDVPVISQGSGADSASVIFDALQSAHSKNVDVLIADTAGRLHTQGNLMDELAKIKRVMSKIDDNAPHETMLVLDSGTGQNALSQAQEFHKSIGINGITLTKLDGTAKGGIVFSLAEKMKLPIRFIGVGETSDDLRQFDADEFVNALLEHDTA